MKTKDQQIPDATIPSKQCLSAPQQENNTSTEEYNHFISKYTNNLVEKMVTFLQHCPNIKYHEQFIPNFHLQICQESINKEVIILNGQWGNFSMKIYVLNIKGSNTKHIRYANRGTYGCIYSGFFNKRQFVMKCLPIRAKSSRFQAVKQWFLMKIASICEVGPKLQPYFGFDILMFEDCIQFAMERCKQIDEECSTFECFYQNLAVLHQLNLVHQDIKPDNLMYSPSFNKPVLIDYGLSKIIKEKTGEKTLTREVGSINFWSPEMKQCFLEKKAKLVDLYNNDLFGMKQTIKYFQSQQNKQKQKKAEIQYIGEQEVQCFQYLSLVLGKYYLYHNRFIQFSHFTKQLQYYGDNRLVNYYNSQIILFLEELCPTRSVKQFFYSFVSDEYKQTTLYSKLNILYQVSKKNVCSLDIMINEDKQKYFEKVTLDMLIQDQQESRASHQSQNISNFIFNKALIRQIPFIRYLHVYLDYTSYISDKYQVSPEKRIEAAEIYHELFLKPEHIHQLTSRQIVGSTIEHALRWCCQQSSNKQPSQKNTLIILTFKLYDFMAILDTFNSADYLEWMNKIYNSEYFSDVEKALFVMRVEQSNQLNAMRLKTKDDSSRHDFFIKITEWVILKTRQRSDLLLKHSIADMNNLSFQFQKQFALQIFKTYIIEKQNLHTNWVMMSEMYYQLIGNIKQPKLLLFLPSLFRKNAKHKQNYNFCKQIQNIFSSCIRDQSIMSQFGFDLSHFILCTFYYQPVSSVTVEDMKYLDSQTRNICITDLYLLQSYFKIIWNVAQQMEILRKLDVSFLYKKQGFLFRMFISLTEGCVKLARNGKIPHRCTTVEELDHLLVFSKRFSEQDRNKVKSILENDKIWSEIGCSRCQNLRKWTVQLQQIRYLFEIHTKQSINNASPTSIQQVLSTFFQRYTSICDKVRAKKHFCDGEQYVIERILDYAEKICQRYKSHEMKFHGIYNYYIFVSKTRNLAVYFQQNNHSYKLPFILMLLMQSSMESLATCLYQIAQLFSDFLIVKWQKQLKNCLLPILINIKAYQQEQLFYFLTCMQKQAQKTSKQNIYIILVYSFISSAALTKSLFQRSLSAVLKKIDQIHFHFKRKTLLNIYDKIINFNSLVAFTKRQQLYYQNKFIKLLMIDDQTIKMNHQKERGSIFQRAINSKLNKIEVFRNKDRVLRYKKK